MNAFYEHHQNNIRFGHRCFDRILLNGLIQPFQQPERVIGFFNTYRNQYPVSRKAPRDISDQFQGWVKNPSLKWDVPILDAPPGGASSSSSRISGMPSPTRWWSSSRPANRPGS